VGANDVAEVRRILLSVPLVLPGFPDEELSGPNGRRQKILTRDRDGVPYLLVFTSVETMRQVLGTDGWRPTTAVELARAWPGLTLGRPLGLAVNPATPVVLLVAPEDVPALTMRPPAGADPALPAVPASAVDSEPTDSDSESPDPDPQARRLRPAMSVPAPVPERAGERGVPFTPANDVERVLSQALEAGEHEVLLDVLVTSRVIVPVDGLVVDGVPTVPVFTSPELCAAFLNGLDVATVSMDLVAVLQQWPAEHHRLAVNPGSPIGFSFDGEPVAGLLAYAVDLARRWVGDPEVPAEVPAPEGARPSASAQAPPRDQPPAARTAAGGVPPVVAPAPDDDPPVVLPHGGNVLDLLRGLE
jgi:hypothetical protein